MPPTPQPPPPHFIVFIPGWLGSKLRDPVSGQMVWGDFSLLWRDPRTWQKLITYPTPLEPAGYLDQVVLAWPLPGLQIGYTPLIKALQSFGYAVDPAGPTAQPAAYTFAYDWRQDNGISAQQLQAAIARWQAQHPGAEVWVIAHSNGGVVARWYIEHLEGHKAVTQLFLLGSPRDGTPHALWGLMDGFDAMLPQPGWAQHFPSLQATSRAILRSFPSAYQLIPYHQEFLRDRHNNPISPFTNTAWATTPAEQTLVAEAAEFNQKLTPQPQVPTTCFFGLRKETVSAGEVAFAAGGLWQAIQWQQRTAGDGTVPEWSGVHTGANTIIPLAEVSHLDLCTHKTTLDKLRYELLDKYQLPTMAVVATPTLLVAFEPQQAAIGPGAQLQCWATVQTNATPQVAVTRAEITVQPRWLAALPDTNATAQPLPAFNLWESRTEPGRYEGTWAAPTTPGFYQLQAQVKVPGELPLELNEFVVVD